MNKIKELFELFEKKGGTYWEESWIEENILGKETQLEDIKRLLDTFQDSKIPRSKLGRFYTILNNVSENHHLVIRCYTLNIFSVRSSKSWRFKRAVTYTGSIATIKLH